MRRVVITGVGAVTPLGLCVRDFWEGLREGRGGIRPIRAFDAQEFPVRIAGEVPGFDATAAVLSAKDKRHLDRFARIAIVAAEERAHTRVSNPTAGTPTGAA